MNIKTARANVSPVRQRTQYTCMSTSMMMCLQALGHDCTEDEVNRVMGARPMKGASWEQALACAQHYGCRATLTMPATVEQLKTWTDAGIPIMIAWNPEGRDWSHASVVFDVDDDLNVYVADPNIPNPKETVRVVSEDDFYHKWFEKFPDYLVRRPACAIEREITVAGAQIAPRTANMRTASEPPKPKSKWDKLSINKQPFGWASPAPGIDGTVPMPWRVSHADRALVWLKTLFDYTDIYTDYESDKFRGHERIWVGLRDNRDKQAHRTRIVLMHEFLKEHGWPVMYDQGRLWLMDDLQRDALRGHKMAKAPQRTAPTQDDKRREQNQITGPASPRRNEVMRGLIERGQSGAGKHKNKRDYDRGHARNPKHRNREMEAALDSLVARCASTGGTETYYEGTDGRWYLLLVTPSWKNEGRVDEKDYGPFRSLGEAEQYRKRHHANPGLRMVEKHKLPPPSHPIPPRGVSGPSKPNQRFNPWSGRGAAYSDNSRTKKVYDMFLYEGDDMQEWSPADLWRHVAQVAKVNRREAEALVDAYEVWRAGRTNNGEFRVQIGVILSGDTATKLHFADDHGAPRTANSKLRRLKPQEIVGFLKSQGFPIAWTDKKKKRVEPDPGDAPVPGAVAEFLAGGWLWHRPGFQVRAGRPGQVAIMATGEPAVMAQLPTIVQRLLQSGQYVLDVPISKRRLSDPKDKLTPQEIGPGVVLVWGIEPGSRTANLSRAFVRMAKVDEALMDRAAMILQYMDERAAIRKLVSDGVSREDAFLAVKAGKILNRERAKRLARTYLASYSGNPDGKPIYDVKVDHGETHALSGGHDIMKRLQDQYRIEQGGEARENQEKRLASWDWRKDGIPPRDSRLVGKKWTGRVLQQWGKHHTGAPFAIIPRDTRGMRGQQDPYQKVIIQDGTITHDFGSVPQLPKAAATSSEWAMNRPYSGMVSDAFIARIKAHPELRHIFSAHGKNATLFLADYFDDPEYNGGSEYDVSFFQVPDAGLWRFNVGMTHGDKIIKKLSALLRIKPDRIARWNANTPGEVGPVERLARRFLAAQGGNV